MKALVDIVLRVAELAEAEGRAAKRNTATIIAGALIGLGGVCLFVVGVAALLGALYLILADSLPPAGALTVVAFIPLFVGLLAIIAGRAALRR